MKKVIAALNKPINVSNHWDTCVLAAFFLIFVFQSINWSNFPLFLDCYYHLSVMRGFADAGGWVGVSFWEYAPFGRPHLYPPLFHLLELAAFKLGLGPITIARLFDFFIYPFFLFVNWRIIRNLFSKELAFFNFFILASSYPLYLAIINNIPFVLALLLCLLSYYFFHRSRYFSSIICLALSFYAHALMSWFGFAAFLLAGLIDLRSRKSALWVCFFSCILIAPILVHQISYIFFIHSIRLKEFYLFSVNLVLCALAFIGFWLASFKMKGASIFFVLLSIIMSVLILTNRDRFFSGHGLVPLSFLAAVACSALWFLVYSKNAKWLQTGFFMVFFLVFYIATPSIVSSPSQKAPIFSIASQVFNYSWMDIGVHSDKGLGFYKSDIVDAAVRLVEDNSSHEDIVYSNYNYGGGMIAMLANRATSTAMLHEVMPFHFIDPVAQARLVLLFNNPENLPTQERASLVKKYNLKKVGESELVSVYLNDNCAQSRKIIKANVSFWFMFSLLLAALAGIFLENKIIKKKLT